MLRLILHFGLVFCRLFRCALSLFRFLLILLGAIRRGLVGLVYVVHEVINALLVHLFVRVVKLGGALSVKLLSLPLVVALALLAVALPLKHSIVAVVDDAILGLALAEALAALRLPLVHLVLVAIAVNFVAHVVLSLSCRCLRIRGALLLSLLLALEGLLLHEVGPRVLVEIEVERARPVELLISLRDAARMAVVLDLSDFLQVLFQVLACLVRPNPLFSLLDYRINRLVLDHRLNVDAVVHLSEDAALIGVLDVDVLEELQPEGLQLVRVVLEQVEVVADCGENLVEVLLQLASVVFCLQLLLSWRGGGRLLLPLLPRLQI